MTAPDERAAVCPVHGQPYVRVACPTCIDAKHADWLRLREIEATHARRLEQVEAQNMRCLAEIMRLERRLEKARAALASSRREREDWGRQIEGHLLYAPPLRCPVCASADEGVRAMVGCPCLPTCAEREENYRAALALARLSPPPPVERDLPREPLE
jgi:hypothetical protein